MAALWLAVPASAQDGPAPRPQPYPRFPGFYSRLSLPELPPERAVQPGTAAELRFGPEAGPGRFQFFLGATAGTLLFSLAAVNAFVPRWLPRGAPERWGLNGQGRTSTPYQGGGAP